MAADQKAKYEINLVDKYSKKLDQIDKKTADFDTRVLGLGKTLTGVFAGGAILAGMGALVVKSSKLAGEMEQTEIAFETFLGSGEKMRQVIGDLNEFANKTSFTNDEIIKTGRTLLAANVPAEELTSTLQMVGDIAAGTKVPIQDLGAIYSKVMNKGKLQAEELNQLAERGIPIIDQLSKEFGVTKQQVFELGSKGKITSDVMVKAFRSMTKEGGKFFNLMEKQSQSAVGLLSTLEGKTELLGINIGKRLLPAQKAMTRQTISLVDKLNEWVKIPTAEAIRDEQTEVNRLTLRLRDGNTKEAERRDILKQLEKISPDIVKGLKAEKIETGLLSKNLEAYNAEAAKRIVLANLTDDEQKQAVKQAGALTRKLDAEDRIRQKLTGNRVKELEAGGDLVEIAKKEVAERERIIKANRNQVRGLGALQKSTTESMGGRRRAQVQQLEGAVSDLVSARYDLNEAEEKSLDIGQRADRLRKLLGLGGGTPPEVVTGKIEGVDDVTAGITKITSAAPKVFNINIGNLVENFEISTTNLTEGAGEARDMVLKALLEGLADVQPLAR
jgi:tape measure domain-containing protein